MFQGLVDTKNEGAIEDIVKTGEYNPDSVPECLTPG